MDKSAKIYISGHSGMLGSALVKKLKNDGYTNLLLRTIDELDLTDQTAVNNFFEQEKPEYVFHIAAIAGGVGTAKQSPTESLYANAMITLNVIKAAHVHNAKGLVYVASAAVYPENAPQPMNEELFLTGKPEFFLGGYALAKCVGIMLCETIHRQFGKDFFAVLPANMYGLNSTGSTVIPMLVRKFADAVKNGESSVTCWGTGNARREFINSEDVANACVFVLEKGAAGELYNAGNGNDFSIREIAELIKKISGFKGEIIWDTTKPEGAPARTLDSTKLQKLGWSPKIDLENGLSEVYQEIFNSL
jgi:GDP-L-fucose synthase